MKHDKETNWIKQRIILKAMVEQFPSQLTDALDSAYVAGMDDGKSSLQPVEEKKYPLCNKTTAEHLIGAYGNIGTKNEWENTKSGSPQPPVESNWEKEFDEEFIHPYGRTENSKIFAIPEITDNAKFWAIENITKDIKQFISNLLASKLQEQRKSMRDKLKEIEKHSQVTYSDILSIISE